MKRWSALLLLLLLPFTMAPRTSIDGEHLDVDVDTPRSAVKVGNPLPMAITLTNGTEDATKLMPVWIRVSNGSEDVTVKVRSRTRSCAFDGDTVGCFIRSLDAGESKRIRLRAVPSQIGRMVVEIGTEPGDSSLSDGPIAFQVVER